MPSRFPNLRLLSHPLIQHKLSYMRNKKTPPPLFRQLLKEISLLMGYEITRDLALSTQPIQTPLEDMQAQVVLEEVAIVPILRAGLGMLEGLLDLMPTAVVGHIGLYRDHETKKPIEYFVRLPATDKRLFILLDPMLATGHSAVYGIKLLENHGIPLDRIRFMSLLVAPEGMDVFNQNYSQVPVYTASVDRCLNQEAYILPGLGDAGDRLFGTL